MNLRQFVQMDLFSSVTLFWFFSFKQKENSHPLIYHPKLSGMQSFIRICWKLRKYGTPSLPIFSWRFMPVCNTPPGMDVFVKIDKFGVPHSIWICNGFLWNLAYLLNWAWLIDLWRYGGVFLLNEKYNKLLILLSIAKMVYSLCIIYYEQRQFLLKTLPSSRTASRCTLFQSTMWKH